LRKQELITPALLLDLDAFEDNLKRMHDRVRASGKALRPHAKAHKCAEIAKRQVAAGAVGVCVATLAEAELMRAAGIPSLLYTSPVADPAKMKRIAATGAMVVVDHLDQVRGYQETGAKLDVLVDLDVGDHRTGAAPEQGLVIASAIAASGNLKLRGIQAYSVMGSHAGGFAGRKKVSSEALALAGDVFAAMKKDGLDVDVLTGGSTGTWEIDTQIPQLTEMQAGSYVLMDMAYRKEGLDFRNAMTVLSTVVSANHSGFVTIDAGTKSFSTDRGYGPEAAVYPELKSRWGGDEFCYLEGARLPRLGEKIELIPPHCDPTANLYDRIHACRGGEVEAVWPLKRLVL
jgi:D-serine deaminase-like pyridoxal phosphate-dependent protein